MCVRREIGRHGKQVFPRRITLQQHKAVEDLLNFCSADEVIGKMLADGHLIAAQGRIVFEQFLAQPDFKLAAVYIVFVDTGQNGCVRGSVL